MDTPSTKPTVKGGLSAAAKFGEVAVGLTASAVALKQVDSLIPVGTNDMIKKLAPGLATALIAFFASTKIKNPHLQMGLIGIGTGGFVDILRKTLADKVKFIADNAPAMSGLSGQSGYAAVNTGGVGWNYYRDNSLQGLGDAYALNGGPSYALSGTSMQGTSMQGTSMQGYGGGASQAASYALNGPGAYALN